MNYYLEYYTKNKFLAEHIEYLRIISSKKLDNYCFAYIGHYLYNKKIKKYIIENKMHNHFIFDLKTFKYALKKGCKIHECSITNAIRKCYFKRFKYIYEKWLCLNDNNICSFCNIAITSSIDSLKKLEYLYEKERKLPEDIYENSAYYNNLECLKFIYNHNFKFDDDCTKVFIEIGLITNIECFTYTYNIISSEQKEYNKNKILQSIKEHSSCIECEQQEPIEREKIIAFIEENM